MNLDQLTPEASDLLDSLVHQVASEAASCTINSSDQMSFLTARGWTEAEILDHLREGCEPDDIFEPEGEDA